jgi:hypothetical protein
VLINLGLVEWKRVISNGLSTTPGIGRGSLELLAAFLFLRENNWGRVRGYLRAQAQSPLRFISVVSRSSSSVGINTRIIPGHKTPTLTLVHVSALCNKKRHTARQGIDDTSINLQQILIQF